MKGDAKIIEILNDVLTAELTAINQYFVHAEMCENWGYERLQKKIRYHSIGEMKHAEELIERVLFLEGVPNEEEHVDWLEVQLSQIEQVGIQNDLAAQIRENES